MDSVVATHNLTKRYGRLTAVDCLNLQVGRGDVFGFLGPNGAGKSTTLRMMVGLVRPTSGSLELFGRQVWGDRRRALSRVGAMIETPAFYKYLSGRDNLRIFANSGGHCPAKDIDAALDAVGLLDRARDKVRSYSHGMRQRLGIALAIAGKPELVLLDEPTNGLDPQGMKEVRDLIKRLATDMGLTVFLSSHLLHEVEQTCSRIAIIDKGRVIAGGCVEELLRSSGGCDIVAEPVEEARRVIQSVDWARLDDARDGVLSVKLTKPSHELNKLMVERGIAVSAIIPNKRSLEELYLKVVGEEARADADQI